MPHPRGKPRSMHCSEDTYHVSEKVTRRSQTGTSILFNQAPFMWMGKKHNLVETSTFGSEFTALKLAVKLVIAFQYKLHKFEVPLQGTTYI